MQPFIMEISTENPRKQMTLEEDFQEFPMTSHEKIILDNLELTAKLILQNSPSRLHKLVWASLFRKSLGLRFSDEVAIDKQNFKANP